MSEIQRRDLEAKDKATLLVALQHALDLADRAGFTLAAVYIQSSIDALDQQAEEPGILEP